MKWLALASGARQENLIEVLGQRCRRKGKLRGVLKKTLFSGMRHVVQCEQHVEITGEKGCDPVIYGNNVVAIDRLEDLGLKG